MLTSGIAPIRAKKVRYFEDRELRTRILPPPKTVRALPTIRQQPVRQGEWADIVEPPATEPAAPSRSSNDRANSGPRREPELPQHEDVVPPPSKAAQEFESPPQAAPTSPRRNLSKRLLDTARQASLDLGDDMGM